VLKRVLIANRGEIAIRIARAASSLGIESVAVYAPVDSLALHTRFATESREIGQGSVDPVSAYLDAEALVQIALSSGCDCVHPGYGFLSENAHFAELCATQGLTFIGPPVSALDLFGDKVQARTLARSLAIPVVSGSESALSSATAALDLADEIGYPVMLKAAAGGGGRGIRLVASPDDMVEGFERCASESKAAFGDGSLFLEQAILKPRHIEVQILCDSEGNAVHLFERDCSVQIRHQKVIEIAPAPGLDDKLREKIFADALKLARAVDYVNAGTVEFLVVPETGDHFFIECNPRIQVEHTITEQITGVDLVEAQFGIASGETLASMGLAEQVSAPRGYAIQARVVAQGAGLMTAYTEPSGPGIRVDSCAYQGYAPPPQFDPLFAKLIVSSNSAGTYHSAIKRAEFSGKLVKQAVEKGGYLSADLIYYLGDGDKPDYVGGPDSSLQAMASAAFEEPGETFLRLSRETDGKALFTLRFFNQNLEIVADAITSEFCLPGLGDAGAHVGQVMDSGWTTFLLSHWQRDTGLFSLPEAVRRMTSAPAHLIGLKNRGLVRPGMKADINVINLEALSERMPEMVNDFPGGAARLIQKARGYRATVCNGKVILENDEFTGARAGTVLRH